MSVTISPAMNLPIATVGNEAGPNYAFDANTSFTLLDQHDHTSGKGVQITPAGLNINAALTFANHPATNLQASTYTAQASLATLLSVYVKGVDLYYRDGNNNEIPITTAGSVNAGAGSITGLPSGTAGVAYAGGQFTFSAATNTPANILVGSVIIGNNSALSKYLTLAPPSAMAANFTITLPFLPGSQSIMTIDNTGAIATPVVYPIPTAGIANLAITAPLIANNTITSAQIANATLTTTQISASAGITGSQLATAAAILPTQNSTIASGYIGTGSVINFNTTSASPVLVTNSTAVFGNGFASATDRPTFISFTGSISLDTTDTATFSIEGFTALNSAILGTFVLTNPTAAPLAIPAGCLNLVNINYIHAWTSYKLFVSVAGGTPVRVTNAIMQIAQV